jgi:hypothetical protein
LTGKEIWDERFKSIREFERHLARNGTLVLKFFLHISKEEQRQRFLARLDEPAKRWKFEMGDVAERKLWDKYMHAYEDAIRHTSRPEAPWHVVPADNKRFARLVIAESIVEAMENLDLQFPKVEGAALKELKKVRRALLAEAPNGNERRDPPLCGCRPRGGARSVHPREPRTCTAGISRRVRELHRKVADGGGRPACGLLRRQAGRILRRV